MAQESANPGVGFEFPRFEVKWGKRDVLLFANSIGATYPDQLHFLYEHHPAFAPFPTYATVLPFKRADADVIDFRARSNQAVRSIPGVPALEAAASLDGERAMVLLRPLPVTSEGRRFELRGRVLGVYDKGRAGSVVVTEECVVDAEEGDVYTRAVGSVFYVGQGGWGGPRGPKPPTFPPPSDRAPDATRIFQTTLETPHLYRLNGDYNPLHADPAASTRLGFARPILHGLFSWNLAANAVLAAFGASQPGRLEAFQARFAAPVMPGDKLVIDMWRMGVGMGAAAAAAAEEIRFVVRVEGGKTVLTNGRAMVKRGEEDGEGVRARAGAKL